MVYSAHCLQSLPHFHQTEVAVERWTPSQWAQPGLVLGLIPSILGKDVAGVLDVQPMLPVLCLPFNMPSLSAAHRTHLVKLSKKNKQGLLPQPAESESG